MQKKPESELGKLVELHGEASSSGKAPGDEPGAKVERADGCEPPVLESVKSRLLLVISKILFVKKKKNRQRALCPLCTTWSWKRPPWGPQQASALPQAERTPAPLRGKLGCFGVIQSTDHNTAALAG